jgi:ribonuclease P protein component
MAERKDLSPVETLKSGKEFSEVRSNRCCSKARTHILFVMRAANSEISKGEAGIIASKKVGNAVIRNKVRRRFREILRHHKSEIAGLKVVIFAFDAAGTSSYEGLESEFLSNLRRANARMHAKHARQ